MGQVSRSGMSSPVNPSTITQCGRGPDRCRAGTSATWADTREAPPPTSLSTRPLALPLARLVSPYGSPVGWPGVHDNVSAGPSDGGSM